MLLIQVKSEQAAKPTVKGMEVQWTYIGAVCGADSSELINECLLWINTPAEEGRLGADDQRTAFVALIGGQPAAALVMFDGNGDVHARDGGSGDADGVVNGRIQVKGLTTGSYRFRIEGDVVNAYDSWSLSMEEFSASVAGSNSDDTPWLTWALVACGVLAVTVLICRVIWWIRRRRRRDTTPVSQDNAVTSSSWPSRPWHDEEFDLEKNAPWM